MGFLTGSYDTPKMSFAQGSQAMNQKMDVKRASPEEVHQLEIPRCLSNLSKQVEDLVQLLRILGARLDSAGVLSPLSDDEAKVGSNMNVAHTALGQALDGESCRVYSAAQAIRDLTMRLEA